MRVRCSTALSPTEPYQRPEAEYTSPFERALKNLLRHDERSLWEGALPEVFDGEEDIVLHAARH
jgi:hypothetical protein